MTHPDTATYRGAERRERFCWGKGATRSFRSDSGRMSADSGQRTKTPAPTLEKSPPAVGEDDLFHVQRPAFPANWRGVSQPWYSAGNVYFCVPHSGAASGKLDSIRSARLCTGTAGVFYSRGSPAPARTVTIRNVRARARPQAESLSRGESLTGWDEQKRPFRHELEPLGLNARTIGLRCGRKVGTDLPKLVRSEWIFQKEPAPIPEPAPAGGVRRDDSRVAGCCCWHGLRVVWRGGS